MTTLTPVLGELLRTRLEIDRMEWTSLDGTPGVSCKTFWTDARGESSAGLMKLEPSAQIPQHGHRSAMHHMWIVDGYCYVGDERMATGSYDFVPPGADHSMTKAGPDGCIIMYVYILTAAGRD
jgi:anti-sigma factor ChrR (cupin superfamily)